MTMEWHRPSAVAALNAAAGIAGLYATRDDVIGWGPVLANGLRNISEHPDAAIALLFAGGLVAYANWRSILHVLGFRERPAPQWKNDDAISSSIHDWVKRGMTISDKTAQFRAKTPEISFVLVLEAGAKVTVTKAKDVDALQVSGRVTPSEVHAASIYGMEDDDYHAMKDEIRLELVKFGVGAVIAERLVPGRGAEVDGDGDEIPEGVFIAEVTPISAFSPDSLATAVNSIRRGIAIAQVVIRKHVRLEDARRGRPTKPANIAPELSVVASTSETTPNDGLDQVEKAGRSDVAPG